MRQDDSIERPVDPLSELGRRVLKVNAGEAYSGLVVEGSGNSEAKELLAGKGAEDLFSEPPKNRDEAACVQAALYLWHDCLSESHTISQSISSASGSFWHSILHRREGDFSNSKYWYARCENHPALAMIGPRVGDLINPLPADKSILRLTQGGWNPNAFVDFVQEVHGKPAADPRRRLAVALQQAEWTVLFDYCLRTAALSATDEDEGDEENAQR